MIEPSSNEQAILETVKHFAAEQLAPAAFEVDEKAALPSETLRGMADLGLFGLMIPETYGGIFNSHLLYYQVICELAKSCAAHAITLISHCMCAHGISEFGSDTFVVDALPSYFTVAAPAGLLVDIAHGLERAGGRGSKGRWREESIAQTACKAAVKARDRLTLTEIERLVVDLSRAQMPYTCPHGRPTLIFTSFQEMNKKFARE